MSSITSDAVRIEWAQRVVAEYRSSAVTQQLTLWLTRIGASPDLIDAGLRISSDELEHARLSHETYAAAGGRAPVALDRATLRIGPDPDDEALEASALDAAITFFCLGETVAVPLFRHLRSGCEAASARHTLDKIVRDEARHSSFGWDLLDWLLSGPCLGDEDRIAATLPGAFRALERSYGRGSSSDRSMSEADRAWGLAPRPEYADILETTFERVWKPRFAAYGVDAAPAWHARKEADT